MLLAGICAMVWWYAVAEGRRTRTARCPTPIRSAPGRPRPRRRATLKYFWVVSALILVQILLGVVTAHYGVEGDGFYGIKLSHILPYSVTPHVARADRHLLDCHRVAGRRPVHRPAGQRQRAEVPDASASTSCSARCCVIVVGSLTGEWLSVQNKLSDANAFLWGHQGYEYVDLGRGWQILLFVGLLLWLFLVVRALRPALEDAGRAEATAVALPAVGGAPSACSTARA